MALAMSSSARIVISYGTSINVGHENNEQLAWEGHLAFSLPDERHMRFHVVDNVHVYSSCYQTIVIHC